MKRLREDYRSRIIQQYYVVIADEPNLSPRLALENAYLKVFMADELPTWDPEDKKQVDYLKRVVVYDDEKNRSNLEEVIRILIEDIT